MVAGGEGGCSSFFCWRTPVIASAASAALLVAVVLLLVAAVAVAVAVAVVAAGVAAAAGSVGSQGPRTYGPCPGGR